MKWRVMMSGWLICMLVGLFGQALAQETATEEMPTQEFADETALGPAPEVLAPWEYVELVGDLGSVNWNSGEITGVGGGMAPVQIPPGAQAEALAARMAGVAARRNLMEVLQGLRIDSSGTVGELMASNAALSTELRALVQNSPLSFSEFQEDGSVMATARLMLRDDLAQKLLPKPKPFVPTVPVLAAEEPAQAPEELAENATRNATVELPAVVLPDPGRYTGLIIDARGLGAHPALSPRILDEQGMELYGPDLAFREFALVLGMAGYVQSLEAAMENSRVAGEPILLLARKATGTGRVDLMLDATEAARFRVLAQEEYVKECRVMIILD